MSQPGQLSSSQFFTVCFSPTRSLALQVPRALVVSAIAACIDTLGYFLLVHLAGWHPLLAATLSYLVGGVVQYVLCSLWVFSIMPGNTAVSFIAFTALSLGGLVITWGVIWLLFDQLHFHYLAAKCVALGLAFCWNFISRKLLIFRQEHASQ
ncbi:MAG: GtrA family protein [Armatimonadota bacterium]